MFCVHFETRKLYLCTSIVMWVKALCKPWNTGDVGVGY